ncbi:hypothetical protein D3C85_1164590 [compost metagenome]
MVVVFSLGPICSTVCIHSRSTAVPTHIGTCIASAISMHSFKSLRIKALENPLSNVRGSTYLGKRSSVDVLRPDPLLSTVSMTSGSSPALTPNTMASDTIAICVADSTLLISFRL